MKPLHQKEDEVALWVAAATVIAIPAFIGIVHWIYLLSHP